MYEMMITLLTINLSFLSALFWINVYLNMLDLRENKNKNAKTE